MEDIKFLYEHISNILADREVDEFELFYMDEEDFAVYMQKGETERYNVNNKCGLSLRVKRGNKIGYASTTVFDEESCRALCDGAIANLDLITLTEEQFIFDGADAVYEKVDAYHPEIDKLTAADKCDMARRLEKFTLEADERVQRVQMCAVMSGSATVSIYNSHSVALTRRSNYLAAIVIPVVKVGDGLNTFGSYVFSYDTLTDGQLKETALEAVTKAIELSAAAPVPSATMNVVFRNEAFMDLLGAFAGIFSAEAAQKKLSLLGKDKLGQIVAAPCVTITDDPFIAEGLNSSPFDDEGVPCTKKDVISAGVLSSMLYNLKSAAADGVKSTGNASKHGYASPIDTGFSNLIVHCGELDFDGLLTKAQSGIIVEDLAGLHSGTDSVTGDFSLSAKGYLFENGKIVRPVGCITVSGNFYTLLKNISELGTDSRWSLSGFRSPSVLVSTLDVGGM